MALKLHVIVVSTRPGRVGPSVARWFFAEAQAHGGFEVELVDLADMGLPIFDEPKHPRLQEYQHAHTMRWSASVAAADAFVFVSPEYNYTAPPTFVNAVDYLFNEWTYKVAGLVTYGGPLAGARAAQMEKLMLTSVKVMTIPEGVSVPLVHQKVGADGVFQPEEFMTRGAKSMLDELVKWAGALKALRG